MTARRFLWLTAIAIIALAIILQRDTTGPPKGVVERKSGTVLIGVSLDGGNQVSRNGELLVIDDDPILQVSLAARLTEAATRPAELFVSGLLDFSEAITFGGDRRLSIEVQSDELKTWTWQLDPLKLDEGRHCVLVLATEKGQGAIDEGRSLQSVAGLYELQLGQGHDSCGGPQQQSVHVAESLFDVYQGCTFPVMSPTLDEVYVKRLVMKGQPLWLMTPRCQDDVQVAFARDETLQDGTDQISPIASVLGTPESGLVFSLPLLPTGIWTCVVTQRAPLIGDELNRTSQCPVVKVS